jgi:diguanylate cyclase (GGDEF)-like protein
MGAGLSTIVTEPSAGVFTASSCIGVRHDKPQRGPDVCSPSGIDPIGQAARTLGANQGAQVPRNHSAAPTFMRGFKGFLPATRVIFSKLSAKTGLPTWILLRRGGASGVIVACQDPLFRQVSGLSFEWETLLLSRIMAGSIPQVIPDVTAVPEADGAQTLDGTPIGAYLVVPLSLGRGRGYLVGLDVEPHGPKLARKRSMVRHAAAMLSALWAYEVATTEAIRRAEHAEAAAMTDALTGAFDCQGWRFLLRREEARCKATNGVAGIIVFDLDGLATLEDAGARAGGKQVVVKGVQIIRRVVRENDVVARLGPHVVALLLPGLAPSEVGLVCARVANALAEAGISASFGYSWRGASRTLGACVREAEKAILVSTRTMGGKRTGKATARHRLAVSPAEPRSRQRESVRSLH